mgnify:CR=1 FL=1
MIPSQYPLSYAKSNDSTRNSPPKMSSFKDLIEMLGDWIIAVKKIATSGCRENVIHFQKLLKTLPLAPGAPNEIIALRGRVASNVMDQKNYDKELSVFVTRALDAYKNCYQLDPERVTSPQFNFDDFNQGTEIDA